MCNSLEPSENEVVLSGNRLSIVCEDDWFQKYYAEQVNERPSFVDWWVNLYGEPDHYGDHGQRYSGEREYWVRMSFAFLGWDAKRAQGIEERKRILASMKHQLNDASGMPQDYQREYSVDPYPDEESGSAEPTEIPPHKTVKDSITLSMPTPNEAPKVENMNVEVEEDSDASS